MARAADSTDSQSTLSEDSIFDRNTNIITNTGRDRDGDGDKDRDAVRDRDQEAEEQAYATQATSLDPTPAGGSLSFCKNVKGEGTVSAVAVASGLAVVEESHLAEAGRSLAGDTASLASRLEMRSEYLTASEGEDGVPRLDNMSMIKRYEHVGTRMEQVERGRGREMGRRRVESLSEPCRGRSGRYGFGLDIRVGERDDLTATRLDRTSTARSVDARADIGGANGIEKYGMEMRNLEEMRRGKTGQGSDVQKKTKGHLTERLCKSLEDDEDVENVEVRDGKLRKAVVALVTKERAQRMWRSLEDGGERWAKAGPVLPGPSRLQRTFRNLKDAVERDENGKAALVLSTPARAQRTSLQSNYSKLVTRSPSVDDEVDEDGTSPPTIRRTPRTDDIPMVDLTEERDDIPRSESGEDDIGTRKRGRSSTSEAHRLVRQHTRMDTGDYFQTWRLDSQHSSGQTTPDIEEDEEDYSPGTRPHQKGVLSSLLELYNPPRGNLGSETPAIEPPTEFSSTDPRFPKLYSTRRIQIAPTSPIKAPDRSTTFNKTLNRNRYSSVRLIPGKVAAGQTLEDEIRITVQLASLLSTQAFILQLCRMLMMYGAPGHRLTIYLRMTADVLGIEAHFVYIPGTVLVYFTDPNTHTTEAKLVKQGRGIDLGKLKEVYDIYDDVVHGLIGVEEAHEQLSAVFYSRSTKKWKKLLLYGITSLSVAPFGESIPQSQAKANNSSLPSTSQRSTILFPMRLLHGTLPNLHPQQLPNLHHNHHSTNILPRTRHRLHQQRQHLLFHSHRSLVHLRDPPRLPNPQRNPGTTNPPLEYRLRPSRLRNLLRILHRLRHRARLQTLRPPRPHRRHRHGLHRPSIRILALPLRRPLRPLHRPAERCPSLPITRHDDHRRPGLAGHALRGAVRGPGDGRYGGGVCHWYVGSFVCDFETGWVCGFGGYAGGFCGCSGRVEWEWAVFWGVGAEFG